MATDITPHWSLGGCDLISAVLVIGDFGQPSRKRSENAGKGENSGNAEDRWNRPFARAAWKEIVEVYTDEFSMKLGKAPEIPPQAPPCELELPIPDEPRRNWTCLYPVPVSDEGDVLAGSIEEAICAGFGCLDVRAVIACGTAKNTWGLLRVLSISGVTVLITIDSTLGDPDEGRRESLRLIPNNEQQAQAIVAQVKTFREEASGDAWLFEHPRGDRYVSDLTKAIMAQAETERVPIMPLLNLETLRPAAGAIVVSVGYGEGFELAHARLQELLPDTGGTSANEGCARLIASDGCYQDERVISLSGANEKVKAWWTHPTVETSQYARDGYKAVCMAWREWGRQESSRVSRGLTPEERLTPFVELVRRQLESEFQPFYRFHARENQRGGYLVEEIPTPPKAGHADGPSPSA